MPDRSSKSSTPIAHSGRRVVVRDESMRPTLYPGDHLRVDRHAYAHSLPVPGEIIILRDPERRSRWLVKRVAAIGPGRFWLFRDRLERLDGPVSSAAPEGATELVELRAGEVFVLSDRLVGARDSRRFGPVPGASVVGRVVFRTGPAERAGPL